MDGDFGCGVLGRVCGWKVELNFANASARREGAGEREGSGAGPDRAWCGVFGSRQAEL